MIYIVAAMLIGTALGTQEGEGAIQRSYFNAMLLQQQKMAEMLEKQAVVIEQLSSKKK